MNFTKIFFLAGAIAFSVSATFCTTTDTSNTETETGTTMPDNTEMNGDTGTGTGGDTSMNNDGMRNQGGAVIDTATTTSPNNTPDKDGRLPVRGKK